MKRVLQTMGLGFGTTLAAGSLYLAFEEFVLGQIDPKWGGPGSNFGFGFYLLAVTTALRSASPGPDPQLAPRSLR